MNLTRLFAVSAVFAAASLGLQGASAQERIGEFANGSDYERLPDSPSASAASDRVVVAEVFMYSCPHCYSFEPLLEEWAQTEKADYIELERIPAPFNDWAVLLGRAYYAAEILGKSEEMHSAFFREIHETNNPLQSVSALREFFARYDVSGETFDEVYNSDQVTELLKGAASKVVDFRISGTPSIVVNGRYLTMGSMAGSGERWFDIIEALAASEARRLSIDDN